MNKPVRILMAEQVPCTAIGIYPSVTAAYIGDIITFFVAAQPSEQSYLVEIRDQDNNLIGTCTTTGGHCSFDWDTTGQAPGTYTISATTNGCTSSIPIPIELIIPCTSIDISADTMSAYVGDTITFTVTVQPSTQSYPVAIIDQDDHLVAHICTTSYGICSSSWDTTGRTAGTYIISAVVGKCRASIPITLLPACISTDLSVDKTSAYVGDTVIFTVAVQPLTISYPVTIRDQDNNLIGTCTTYDDGTCSLFWNTKGAAAKSYIITASVDTQCVSTPVTVTLEKNPIGAIIVTAGLIAAIIYIITRKRQR